MQSITIRIDDAVSARIESLRTKLVDGMTLSRAFVVETLLLAGLQRYPVDPMHSGDIATKREKRTRTRKASR
jgi:hypothetical protein